MRLASFILLLCLIAAGAAAERRVALVIGNAAYKESPLRNPANDARAMANALKGLGFQVIARENVTKLEMERAVADFGDALRGGGAVGLFFFAGHGMQVQGKNYLVPVDARIATETRVRLEALDLDAVLDEMAASETRVNLVVLDACRNNPFERRFRAAGGGLAQVNAPQGTLIAYATAPGKTAADGTGSNGLYTSKLLEALSQPALPVEEVFKRVRVQVAKASGNDQTPWESSSLTGSFYFQPPAPRPPPAAQAPAPAAPPPPAPVADKEIVFWQSIQASSDAAMFEAYLAQFPQGTFAPLARAKLAQLRPPAAVAIPAPAPPAPVPVIASGGAQTAPRNTAAGPAGQNVALAAPPRAAFDGSWRGVMSCGASPGNGPGAFASGARVFTVRDGHGSERFSLRRPDGALVEETYRITVDPDGSVAIRGESRLENRGSLAVWFKGKIAGDRLTAQGRHGERSCTLDYRRE